MTFTYKLARRLAGLPVMLAAAAVTVLGCTAEDQPELLDPSADSAVRGLNSRVRVTPDSLTLETGQSYRFKAYSVSSRDSVETTVEWSVTGGTISSDGLYTSATTGKFRVIGARVKSRWNRTADTSVVLVVAPVTNVARVALSPDTATVLPGAHRTFTALGQRSDSSTVPIGVTWSAQGGTIEAGDYTAGTTPGTYRVIAANADGTLADTSLVTIPDPPSPTMVQVVLWPASVTLAAGATQQFRVWALNSAGDSVAAAVTYAATGGTISSTGLYSAGSSAGTFAVIATATGGTHADTASVTVTATTTPPPTTLTGWYVAPGGTSGAQGTSTSPWSLAYALQGAGGRIRPGDTVWVRGGNYNLGEFNSSVAGTASAPVIIRQYPGERATLDMSLNVMGGYVWFWGMEVKQGNLAWQNLMCFNDKAPGIRHINLIVHDCSGNGLGMWVESPDAEAYGNLLYNNGRAGASAGRYAHGIYFQNSTGTKTLKHNVVFNSYSHNFHGWAGDAPAAHRNYTIEENVSVNSGQFVSYGGREYLIGGGQPVENLIFRRNIAHRVGNLAQTSIGYYDGTYNPGGSSVTDNYMSGSLEVYRFSGLTVTGNTVVSSTDNAAILRDKGAGTWNWDRNSYYRSGSASNAFVVWNSTYAERDFPGWKSATGVDAGSSYVSGAPTGQRVTVLPNRYEAGRAFVVVWNWSGAGSATVDLSGVLAPGQAYSIRNVQRVWDSPVASGTYSGAVSVPLTAVTAYAPLGPAERPASPTGTQFHTFLVEPR